VSAKTQLLKRFF